MVGAHVDDLRLNPCLHSVSGLATQAGFFTPSAATGGGTLLDGIQHWYALTASGTTEVDLVGSSDLTIDGTDDAATVGGAPNGDDCRHFDGVTLLKTASMDWSAYGGLTLSFWAYYDASLNYLWEHRTSQGSSAYRTLHSARFDDTAVKNNITTEGTGDDLTPSGNWYMFTITAGDGNLKVYQNGSTLRMTHANELVLAWHSGTFAIGANWTSTRSGTVGNMTSCGIWNRILSAAEMNELYNSGSNLRYADL